MTASTCCLLLATFLSMVSIDSARPSSSSPPSSSQDEEAPLSSELVSYLSRFGYLPRSEHLEGALMTEEQVRDALRNLQFFAGLESTGRLDGATAALLLRPRCGVPDVAHEGYRNRRYALQGQRWSRTNLTWSLSSAPPSRGGAGRDLVRRELGQALQMWARQSGLSFSEVTDAARADEADLRVSFRGGFHGDGYPFDGAGSVLAHAFFPGSGRGGDVHFDDDETWTAEESQRGRVGREAASVFAVALHEFGHSLGLSHSSVEGSLMFPWYSGAPADFLLPDDDRMAIQHLYGRATFETDLEDALQTRSGESEDDDSDNDFGVKTASEEEEEKEEEPERESIPDPCATNFDAVAVIRSEVWVFKDRYFWRLPRDDEGSTDDPASVGDPIELSAFWYGLPGDVDRVDAVYERPDHKIVFFVGRNYFVLTGNSQLESGPNPIERLGLPASLEKVDAAMRWGWNGKTYFFSGSVYWRFDEEIQHVELDYPRDFPSVWRGVPSDVDAAFQHTDGSTHFFRGDGSWRFDDWRMRVEAPLPTPIADRWMRCGSAGGSRRGDIRDPFRADGGPATAARARKKEGALGLGVAMAVIAVTLLLGAC